MTANRVLTDAVRQDMTFSFRNGTNDCIIHGPTECGNWSYTVADWGYFGVFDGAARQVWTQDSAGNNVLLNSVIGLATDAAFRETCKAGEIRGLWDRHGNEAWSTDSMLLCAPVKTNEVCVASSDDNVEECIALDTIPDGFGSGGDGRIYLAGDVAVGLYLDEFLAGVTDDNRDVETSPVWEGRLPAITTAMESQAVRNLPVTEKKQIFDRLPEVKEARREAKEIIIRRKAVRTVSYPKICLGDSEHCTVIGTP